MEGFERQGQSWGSGRPAKSLERTGGCGWQKEDALRSVIAIGGRGCRWCGCSYELHGTIRSMYNYN